MTAILSNLPDAAGFSVAVAPGNIYSGGAVAFMPQQDCSMAAVTLLLNGYTDKMAPHFALQLLVNGTNNQPADGGFPGFTKPTSNDGSAAVFTFNLTTNAALKSGQIYWVLAYGGIISGQPLNEMLVSNWLGGVTPNGSAQYKGSLGYRMGSFLPSSVVPAFSIGAL